MLNQKPSNIILANIHYTMTVKSKRTKRGAAFYNPEPRTMDWPVVRLKTNLYYPA